MRRNYVKTAITAIFLAAMTVTGIEATYTRVPAMPGDEKADVQVSRKLTPKQIFARRLMDKRATGQLIPSVEGMMPTPKIQEKPRQVLGRIPAKMRGEFHAVVNRHGAMELYSQAYIGTLDANTGKIVPTYYGREYVPSTGEDYVYANAAYKDGVVYIPGRSSEYDTFDVIWNRIDLATGEVYDAVHFGGDYYAEGYSIVYDPSEDLFYTLCFDQSFGSQFSSVNPNDGYKVNYINYLGTNGFVSAICYNPDDQQIYAFNDNMEVYTVNKKDGKMSKVADISSYYTLFNEYEVTRMVYSPKDACFVAVFLDYDLSKSRLVFIDPETWEAEEGPIVTAPSEPYVAGLICPDLYAPADAPELPAAPEFKFDKNSLSGTVTVTAPTVNYMGVKLTAGAINCVFTVEGKTVINENMKPGESKTIDVNYEQGLHKYELSFATDKDNVSPVRKGTFYTGNDNPSAPEDIKLEDGLLSWSAPTTSEHDGYVDYGIMTYDVFVDGEQQNGRPIFDTKYELYLPAQQKFAKIEVVATANQQKSLPGVLNEVVGKAFTLPVTLDPTPEQANLFKIADDNGDQMTFMYINDGNNYGMYMRLGYTNSADDWFFLPSINFDDANVKYELDYNIGGIMSKDGEESYDVYIGKRPTPSAMKNLILSEDRFSVSPMLQPQANEFTVPEAGDYYIGFHLRTPIDYGHGIIVSDFQVSKIDGSSSAVPAAPDLLKIIPGELGALTAKVQAKLPTKDVMGNPLSGDITLSTYCYGSDDKPVEVKGQPGGTVSVSMNVQDNGFNKFYVTLSNANGKGITRNYRAFIGHDRPLCPTSIKVEASEDNMVAHLTWDAPANVGENGGYVDVANLTYNIYNTQGISHYKLDETKELFYDWTSPNPVLTRYVLGPSAINHRGEESRNSLFVAETLGKPYATPVKEEFNSAGFTMNPYVFNTKDKSAGSRWENVSSISSLGVGNGDVVGGALIGYSETLQPCNAELIIPKVNTIDMKKGSFSVRYWDYKDCPTISLYARRFANQELQRIQEIVPKKSARGEWVDVQIDLPQEYLDCYWVEFRLRSPLTGKDGEYVIVDNFEISNDVDYDLKVASVEGPVLVQLGNTAEYAVTVVNTGYERISGKLKVDLIDTDNNVLLSRESNIPRIVRNQRVTTKASFTFGGECRDLNNIAVRATVEADGDEISKNNVMSLDIEVKNSHTPVVNNLKAVKDDATNDVALTWSEPTVTFGDYTSFENTDVEPFKADTKSVDNWTIYDNDGGIPFRIDGLQDVWTDGDKPSSWVVFDAQKAGTMQDERLYPHSGNRMLIAVTNQYDQYSEDFTQACDMLISPEVVGGTVVSFWINHLNTTYTEYIEIWTSTTDNNPESFTYDKNNRTLNPRYSKSGSETWEKVSFKLAPNVKYFAIVYRSIDSFALMLDDINITPKQLCSYEIDHYKMWRALSGEKDLTLIADNLKNTTYSDPKLAANDAIYYVSTVAKDPFSGKLKEGPMSNGAQIGLSAVDDITILRGVYGGKGIIVAEGHSGDTLAVYSADGKFVKLADLNSESAKISIAPGIYIVKCGNAAAKVLVK